MDNLNQKFLNKDIFNVCPGEHHSEVSECFPGMVWIKPSEPVLRFNSPGGRHWWDWSRTWSCSFFCNFFYLPFFGSVPKLKGVSFFRQSATAVAVKVALRKKNLGSCPWSFHENLNIVNPISWRVRLHTLRGCLVSKGLVNIGTLPFSLSVLVAWHLMVRQSRKLVEGIRNSRSSSEKEKRAAINNACTRQSESASLLVNMFPEYRRSAAVQDTKIYQTQK